MVDIFFFFSSRRRHTILQGDWSSDVCSSDLFLSNVIRSAGFGGAGVLYCFALARAFRQKTLKWIGAAVLAALFFGVTCLLFLQGLSEHAGGSRREIADDFSDGQSRFAAYATKLRER